MGNQNRTSSSSETDETDHRLPDDLLDPDNRQWDEIGDESPADTDEKPSKGAEQSDSENSGDSAGTRTVGGGASAGGGSGGRRASNDSKPTRSSSKDTNEEQQDDSSEGVLSGLLNGILTPSRDTKGLDSDAGGIPPSKLDSWSKSGPRTTPKRTKDAISNTLNRSEHLDKEEIQFRVFLQGSYKNHTNIHGDSDVDVVIQLTSPYREDSASVFRETRSVNEDGERSNYSFRDFKSDVVRALRAKYGHGAVTVDDKAIKIHAEDSSLKIDADVVVCQQYREQDGKQAMWFESKSGKRIVNYPQRHYRNGAQKNKETDGRYRETVRMFKRARTNLINKGQVTKDEVPSYFVACLLYNVPNEAYVGDSQERYVRVVNYLHENRGRLSSMMCQHQQHELFGRDSTRWNRRDAKHFIDELIQLYQTWYN